MIAHLDALRARHGILQAKIDRENARPRPDSIRMKMMKKMRLKLREQIYRYELLIAKQAET